MMKQCMIPRLRNRLMMACPDAAYTCARARLLLAGLSENRLRRMDPDQRVTALEAANLDPYDYIYLALQSKAEWIKSTPLLIADITDQPSPAGQEPCPPSPEP